MTLAMNLSPAGATGVWNLPAGVASRPCASRGRMKGRRQREGGPSGLQAPGNCSRVSRQRSGREEKLS